MKKLLILLTITLFVFLTGFTIQTNKPEEDNTKTLSKLQLQELKNPLQYLASDVMVKANLILVKKESPFNDAEYKNDGYLIEGFIKNKADLTNFKNVVFRVNFYSATQTKIGFKDYKLNKSYKPQTNNAISLKIYPPDDYVEFDFEIVKATGT